MAVALGNTEAGYNSGSGTTVTISHTVATGSDRLLLLAAGGATADPASSITYGGVALTRVSGFTYDPFTNFAYADLWYLIAPAVGTANIVITRPEYRNIAWSASDWTGVHQTTPLTSGTHDTGTGNGSGTSSSNTCPANGALFVHCTKNDGSGAPSASSPTTIVSQTQDNTGTGVYLATAYRTSTGTLQFTWTSGTARNWDMSVLALNPAAVAATSAPPVQGLFARVPALRRF